MVNTVIVSVIMVTMLMIRAVIMLKVRGGNREEADARRGRREQSSHIRSG